MTETRPIRVLIVDDNAAARLVERQYLAEWGCQVEEVESGKEALDIMVKAFEKNSGFDICLIDLLMPGMDGWDTINEIVNSGFINDVAISVITGKGTKDFQKMSMLGSYIFDYLTKPIDVEVLIHSLERCNKYLVKRNL